MWYAWFRFYYWEHQLKLKFYIYFQYQDDKLFDIGIQMNVKVWHSFELSFNLFACWSSFINNYNYEIRKLYQNQRWATNWRLSNTLEMGQQMGIIIRVSSTSVWSKIVYFSMAPNVQMCCYWPCSWFLFLWIAYNKKKH